MHFSVGDLESLGEQVLDLGGSGVVGHFGNFPIASDRLVFVGDFLEDTAIGPLVCRHILELGFLLDKPLALRRQINELARQRGINLTGILFAIAVTQDRVGTG